VALLGLIASCAGPTPAGAAIFTWANPAAITTADATLDPQTVLGQTAFIAGAECFGTTEKVVTLTDGTTIDFKADNSVASATGCGTATGAWFGAGKTTGNAAFDSALDEFNWDCGPKKITLYNLITGASYWVQLFALDARVGESRQCYFVDPSDTNNISAVVGMGDYAYVVGSFVAGSNTQDIIEELLPSNAANINDLVVYTTSAAAASPRAQTPQASPANTVFGETTVTLSVQVTGPPPFQYQWLKDGGPLNGATGSTLVLTNSTVGESGNYAVEVSNSYGSGTSPALTVTITPPSPPLLTSEPAQPLSLFLQDTITLATGVIGSPPIALQWQKDGAGIPGATNATLVFSSIDPTNAGTYILMASNSLGTTNTTPVTLTVIDSIQFSWFPPTPITTADATINQRVASLRAEAFGGTEALVTLASGTTIDFLADNSVASVTGQGTFYGAYPAGTTATTGNTNFDSVLNGASWDGGPKKITLYGLTPGNLYAAQLFALDNRGGVNGRAAYFSDPMDPGNASAHFTMGANDFVIGIFTANSTNQTIIENLPNGNAGNMNALVLYGLTPAPLVWATPTASPTNELLAGYDMTLAVSEISGTQPYQYQWMKGGVNVSGATNSTLVLTNTTVDQSGNYDVMVSNSAGSSVSPAIAVTIIKPSAPIFTSEPTQPAGSLFLQDVVTFAATVSGSPPIAFQWQQDGVNIAGATNATLVLSNIQPAGAGSYTLVASNFVGMTNTTPVTVAVIPTLQFTWYPTNAITTADYVLAQRGSIIGAEVFGAAEQTVTLTNGTVIDFKADNSVASVTGLGTAGNAYSLTAPVTTGNAGLDAVLNEFNWDGAPKTITIYGLTPGNLYSAQLFALDDRGGGVQARRAYYEDPNDPANVSDEFEMGENVCLVGLFIANGTDQIIIEQCPGTLSGQWVSQANLNALVLRGLPKYPVIWGPLTASPSNTVYSGQSVTLSLDPSLLTGIPPYQYQWRKGGVDLPGDTNSTLVLGNTTVAHSGSYDVVISNSFGSTNSPELLLTVNPPAPPTFPVPPTPASLARYTRYNAVFTAGVAGSPPLALQWQHNGANLAGATTETLTLANLQVSDSGSYTLVAANALGTNISPAATLTVTAPVNGTYWGAVISDVPLAYWRFNETNDVSAGGVIAYDSTGDGFNGVYGTGSVNGVPGPTPSDGFPIFEATNTAVQTAYEVPNSYVSVPPLNLNTNTVTITAWLEPSVSAEAQSGVVFSRSQLTAAGLGFNASGSLSYTWNNNDPGTWDWNPKLVPPASQWSFVALAVAPSNAILYMINANGQTTATNVYTHTNSAFEASTLIGSDAGGGSGSRQFTGAIDEVAIFNYTLTPAQIMALYKGVVVPNVTLTIERAANGQLQVQWPQGTLLQAPGVTGPWTTNNAASPYKFSPTAARQFYRVLVQ
jgi:hypothetical protein